MDFGWPVDGRLNLLLPENRAVFDKAVKHFDNYDGTATFRPMYISEVNGQLHFAGKLLQRGGVSYNETRAFYGTLQEFMES